ncbi:MAG: hypothetical protein AAB658_19530 [Chloroflexota bacterium]
MSRPVIILFILLVGLTAFAQPGLCPCWLMADIQAHHPHPGGYLDRDHGHDYLNDLFSAGLAAVATLSLLPARTLIALLATGNLWRPIADHSSLAHGWVPALEPPPPRLCASS